MPRYLTVAEQLAQPMPPRPKKRVKRSGKPPETALHESIAGLLRAVIGRPGETNADGVFWISLENKPRSRAAAVSNQRRGVKAGFPDVLIIYRGRALPAEIKVPKTIDHQAGRLEASQEVMHPHLARAGANPHIWQTLGDVLVALRVWGVPHKVATL